ncbi:MAG: hypothetical protein ACI9LO_001071 [Planctomycetota bacterium]|jgi:hypothetical protein
MNPKIIALHNPAQDCELIHAAVKGASQNGLVLDLDGCIIKARAAFSCLVAPRAGDRVLVNRSGDDYFVLAVLERAAEQDMTLEFPANVKMTASDGQIDLVAKDDINLLSTARTNLISSKINLTATDMAINSDQLTARTRIIESHSQDARLYTGMLSTVAKQISQKTEVLMRWVEKVETLNIGNLIQNVRKNYTSHSDQAVITARKDMRIDGERIHMG